MGYSITEISGVRAMPVVLAVDAAGRWQTDPGFVEVVFTSSAVGMQHQVYVDGRLAGATLSTADRSVIVAAPQTAASAIEVAAVDPGDRLTDFSASLAGFSAAQGTCVELVWAGGSYLGADLDHFYVYGGPAGAIDYSRPLNAEPIGKPGSVPSFEGLGCGGFGRGGWGRSAMTFTFITQKYFNGTYSFEIRSVDAAGNAASGPQVTVQVQGLPRPPRDLSIASYNSGSRAASLAWAGSPDIE
jgi:hypothetical protein